MNFRSYIISGLAVTMLAASPGFAQKSNRDRNRNEDRSRSKQQSKRSEAAGRVILTKKVGLRNQPIEHLVVVLKNNEGKKAFADLGPVKQLKDAKVRRGDRLDVMGRLVRIGDHTVLMADRIEKNGQSRAINRRQGEGRQRRQVGFRGNRSGQREQDQNVTGRGRIVRTKKVGLRGKPVEHLVVLLKTDRRENPRIVDLGPVKNLQQEKLKTGDQIEVVGEVVSMGDKQILMARQLEADGHKVQIDRRRSGRQATRREARSRQGK